MYNTTAISIIMVVTAAAIVGIHVGACFFVGRHLSVLHSIALIFILMLITTAMYSVAALIFGIITGGSPPYSGKPEDELYQNVYGLFGDPCVDVPFGIFGICLPFVWPLALFSLGVLSGLIGQIGKKSAKRTK